MGRRLHMSRSAQNRNKPSRARLLESVSPIGAKHLNSCRVSKWHTYGTHPCLLVKS